MTYHIFRPSRGTILSTSACSRPYSAVSCLTPNLSSCICCLGSLRFKVAKNNRSTTCFGSHNISQPKGWPWGMLQNLEVRACFVVWEVRKIQKNRKSFLGFLAFSSKSPELSRSQERNKASRLRLREWQKCWYIWVRELLANPPTVSESNITLHLPKVNARPASKAIYDPFLHWYQRSQWKKSIPHTLPTSNTPIYLPLFLRSNRLKWKAAGWALFLLFLSPLQQKKYEKIMKKKFNGNGRRRLSK